MNKKQGLYFLVILFFALIGFTNCGGSEQACGTDLDLSSIEIAPVKIERLEDPMFQLKSKKEIQQFLGKYPEFRSYMKLGRNTPDSVLVNIIFNMTKEKHLSDTLYPKVKERYQNIEDLEKQFQEAFKRLKYFYPNFTPPKIYTVVTGLGYFFGTDLIVTDKYIFIGLDFFMNPDAPYRPPVEQVPNYIWNRYRRDAIVPLAIKLISDKYNQTDPSDKTVLADMIYWGKSYHFVKTILPCLEDSIIIGYRSEDMVNLSNQENMKYIWGHFIEKDVLYSTNQLVKSAYIDERPYTAEINKKAPGRIGQWLGWKIIRKFVQKNEDISFQELMKNKDAQSIFQKSGYKGE